MAYGLSASADGNTFPWVFNPPATYWDGASVFIKYVAEKEGGLDKLKGKKIGLIHLDAPFGKEPIPLLEALAKEYGFELKLYPDRRAGHAEPGLGLAERPPRPAGLDLQPGLGRDEPDRGQGSDPGRLPDRTSSSASGGPAATTMRAPAAPTAKGYKSLNFHAAGADFPVIKDIQKHVVDKGLSKYPKEKVGENLYNRGVYNSMLIAEGDPQRAEDHRQEGRDRRGRAPRSREPQHHRGPPEGDRHGRLRRPREGLLRGP